MLHTMLLLSLKDYGLVLMYYMIYSTQTLICPSPLVVKILVMSAKKEAASTWP